MTIPLGCNRSNPPPISQLSGISAPVTTLQNDILKPSICSAIARESRAFSSSDRTESSAIGDDPGPKNPRNAHDSNQVYLPRLHCCRPFRLVCHCEEP